MAGTKRQVLTTDDLLRLQEEKPRKRRRASTPSDRSGSVSEDSNSEAEEEAEASNSEDEEELPPQNEPEDEATSSRFAFKPRHTVDVLSKSPPTSSSPVHTFSSLGITPTLVAAMSKMSIQAPTEVQTACIPPLFAGK